MGMAASQARLLSITARLTNNENTGEAVSYAKQRLADQTQQITNAYNEALDKTKLTVLTGFNGAEAVYEDISYARMTGPQMAESNKQYFVTDTRGRLLVTEKIADAYEKSNGNYNIYLAELGYSQADIYVQLNNDTEAVDPVTGLTPTQQKIHDAWDKYFKAVGIDYIIDPEHPENFNIGFFETIKFGTDGTHDGDYNIGDGYAAVYTEEKIQTGTTTRIERQPRTDEEGNILYGEYEDITTTTTVTRTRDKEVDGHKVYSTPLKDEYGNIVYCCQPQTDEINGYGEHVFTFIQTPGTLWGEEGGGGWPVYVQAEEPSDVDGKPVYYIYLPDTVTNTSYYQHDDPEHYIVKTLSLVSSTDGLDHYEEPFYWGFERTETIPVMDLSIPDTEEYEETITTTERVGVEGTELYDEITITEPVYEIRAGWKPLNYEGTTKETRDLFDYAMAITEAYLRVDSDDGTGADNFHKEYDLSDFKSAADSCNNSALKYYRNIFDRIQQRGFITYTDSASKSQANDSYIYSSPEPGKKDKVSKNPLKDSYVFEQALRDGTLRLEYYSTTKKQFISTTISEDNCIQEVADERAIAKAERKYTQDMQDLEAQDKKFDLELKKLDTEHKALETEYESVKSVVNKNVESSFKIFS